MNSAVLHGLNVPRCTPNAMSRPCRATPPRFKTHVPAFCTTIFGDGVGDSEALTTATPKAARNTDKNSSRIFMLLPPRKSGIDRLEVFFAYCVNRGTYRA